MDGDLLPRRTGLTPEKITRGHQQRLAIVYVRQSTPQQVERNQESTKLQYALVDRAFHFGWARETIVTIDDDLGRSGSAIEGRLGFQRLVAEVGLGHVGLVLGIEMSRLARSCRDWRQLLEICALFDTLIADVDGVYDPANYNDRLLLGLKGTMSEAELHILQARMLAGRNAKARRGELGKPLPMGYLRRPSGEVALDPDEQAQGVIRRLILKALAPAAIEASLAAALDLEAERKALNQHWSQRLERAQHQVDQARRRYASVEPENRLVARTLEQDWETAPGEQARLLADHERFQRERPQAPSPAELAAIQDLTKDLPALWRAKTTTQQERQMIARLLLERILVTVIGASEQVRLERHWQGGNRTLHQLAPPVAKLKALSVTGADSRAFFQLGASRRRFGRFGIDGPGMARRAPR